MATRSRKGLWSISTTSIVCKALTDRWLFGSAGCNALPL
jgi:hypothetical protein